MRSARRARDAGSASAIELRTERGGRNVIAAIGINRYREWPQLFNAVNDAERVLQRFTELGFEPAGDPLLDEAATGDALRALIDELGKTLCASDSLVVFFAGHGATRPLRTGGQHRTTGYVIPVNASKSVHHAATTWLRVDQWLSDIARLPPMHILVILDACSSGIALDWTATGRSRGERLPDLPATRHRGLSVDPWIELRSRSSRRVITSALGDQRARDDGEVPGHSLFAGHLLEALNGQVLRAGECDVTGTELGLYLQRRVSAYSAAEQTPDFGAFEGDERGELVLSLRSKPGDPQEPAESVPDVVTVEPEELALEVLIMSSVDENTWSAVPRSGMVPFRSKFRVLVRARSSCSLVLAIEASTKRQLVLGVVTRSVESLRPQEWRQIPQDNLLAEEDPLPTVAWTLHFAIARAGDEALSELRADLAALEGAPLSREESATQLAMLLPARATARWHAIKAGQLLRWGLPPGEQVCAQARPPFVISHELRFA